MIYFDTDVLVNYKIIQDKNKFELSTSLVGEALKHNKFFVSLLTIQEVTFVYSKLKLDQKDMYNTIYDFLQFDCPNYTKTHFNRALELAKYVGTKNINDCIHTAIAESYCDELYTFNKTDFSEIKKHTNLKITIF